MDIHTFLPVHKQMDTETEKENREPRWSEIMDSFGFVSFVTSRLLTNFQDFKECYVELQRWEFLIWEEKWHYFVFRFFIKNCVGLLKLFPMMRPWALTSTTWCLLPVSRDPVYTPLLKRFHNLRENKRIWLSAEWLADGMTKEITRGILKT